MKQLFKDKQIIDNITKIIQDKTFPIKKYWLKKVYLDDLLLKNSKIQYKTSKQILEIYNNYFHFNHFIEDIFNTNFIINYSQNTIEFVFRENDKDNHHFKFIEKILSIHLEEEKNI